MPDALTLRRAWRKFSRPLRKWWHGQAPQFDLEQLQEPTLVVIAHPDDEVFCSGLICALREADRDVSLVCFTRGEGGERVEVGADEDLGEIRQAEMTAAAEALGIDEVRFLDYVDPVGEGSDLKAPEVDSKALVDQLRAAIEETGARNVITHGSSGEYWHPAHVCLHDHVRRAARECHGVRVWTFNAWDAEHPLGDVLNRDDPAQLKVDAEPYHRQRLESLERHASQRAVFERFAGSDLETFVRKTARESYHLAN